MDSTFKASGKALLTDDNQQKSKELRGGILSVINKENEIVAWVSKRPMASITSTDSDNTDLNGSDQFVNSGSARLVQMQRLPSSWRVSNTDMKHLASHRQR